MIFFLPWNIYRNSAYSFFTLEYFYKHSMFIFTLEHCYKQCKFFFNFFYIETFLQTVHVCFFSFFYLGTFLQTMHVLYLFFTVEHFYKLHVLFPPGTLLQTALVLLHQLDFL